MALLSSKTGIPLVTNQSAQSPIRAGTIQAFAGATTPAGWLDCDGTCYLQSAYPELYAQILQVWATCTDPIAGTPYTNGHATKPLNPATQFRTPDLRGAFMRGAGGPNVAGVTTSLAGYQADINKSHTHGFNQLGVLNQGTPAQGGTFATGSAGRNDTSIVADGGVEARPQNVGVKYIIKAFDESFNLSSFALATGTNAGLVAPRKGQVNLTITNAPMSWVTARAVGIYYQDQDGNHRLKFNISGSCSNVAKVTFAMTFASPTVVVFKNIPGYFQALCGIIDGVAVLAKVYVQPGTSAILWEHASAPTTIYSCSGDLELESKPSWA